ncbi:MAG TPA: hypothetical protein VN962_26035 [Polyangia bacterium]|nr:hypothetical protein [Polyangia bacterium]
MSVVSRPSVVLVDDQIPFVQRLSPILTAHGCDLWSATSFAQAEEVMALAHPTHVISELFVGGAPLSASLDAIARHVPLGRLIVTTIFPSVAVATRFARMGIAAYLTKPVPAEAILDVIRSTSAAVDVDAATPVPPAPLDDVIGDYLEAVYAHVGSISGTARRLQLHPRSLRRMLARVNFTPLGRT